MKGHPGGEDHTRRLITLANLAPGSKWLDMGAGDGAALRLLGALGYEARGIDLEPRGPGVSRGDFLHSPFENGSFDGILSQCSFYVSGDVPGALREAARLLRTGGRLVFSDVTEDAMALAVWCRRAGLLPQSVEDLTPIWREYYLEALWREDDVCLPRGKKYSYVLFVCERM